MDQATKPNWFSAIEPPGSGPGQSVDYLDRLIAGGPQHQYHYPNHQQQQKRHEHKHKGQQNKFKTKAKKFITKPVGIDDITWLSDRKKKFPKFGEQQEQPKPQTDDHNRAQVEEPKKERRKTLFEKLMD